MVRHNPYYPPMRTAWKIAKKGYRAAKRQRGSGPTTQNKRRKTNGTRKTAYASTPSQNPINAQAKRASKRVKGHKNVRSIVHRKRRVKVSRPLRKKIQKVIDGESFKGTYHTSRYGTIGITTSGTSGVGAGLVDENETMGGYLDQLAFQRHNLDADGNTRYWFSHALQSTDISGTAGLVQGSEWQFFSPLKIVDAASVLWNSKLAAEDYASQTGNLNTVHVESTGLPVVGTQTNPNIKGLKIMIQNSYVKFKFKNNSQRAMTLCVYNVVPKIKFPAQTPLQAFQDAIIAEADGANSAYMSAVTVNHTSTQQAQALFANPAVEPNMFKTFTSSYKYEKVLIKIAPGETCSHSLQGPKGYELDYGKLWDAGVNKQSFAYKGTTMFCMISIIPDMAFMTAGINTTNQGVTGRYVANLSAQDKIADPVSIQWEEIYRLSIPEITGFKTAAGAAGTMQVLNKKLPRRAFGNFTKVSNVDANPIHLDFDEENPGAGIIQGPYN